MVDLPIGMGELRCQFATDHGGFMAMDLVAVDFYRRNCIGCPQRRQRGVPNLATRAAEVDRQEQEEADIQDRARAEREREREARRRRRASARAEAPDEPSRAVFDDLDRFDAEDPDQAGAVIIFAPGERHSVYASEDATLLLLLAPWPAARHDTDDAEAGHAQQLAANASLASLPSPRANP